MSCQVIGPVNFSLFQPPTKHSDTPGVVERRKLKVLDDMTFPL